MNNDLKAELWEVCTTIKVMFTAIQLDISISKKRGDLIRNSMYLVVSGHEHLYFLRKMFPSGKVRRLVLEQSLYPSINYLDFDSGVGRQFTYAYPFLMSFSVKSNYEILVKLLRIASR